ncbi:RidA family protein [Cupriavidus sp. TMH.W2]|uniref:RidA family protein n=1 Tax=Cupriavidus sp. TMH.W2 TaxID=3434465 RepID=UPI003D77E615
MSVIPRAADPPPLARYSVSRRAGQHVHVSGMSPRTAHGCAGVQVQADGTRTYDMAAQTACVLDKVERALAEHGMRLSDCVTLTCYLVDMADYEAFNAAYAPYFPGAMPARTCVAVAALPHPDMRVEITATAWAQGDAA